MNKSQSMGMYVILGIMVLAFVSMLLAGPNTSTQELSYTDFLQKLTAGEIKNVEIDKDSLIAHPKVQPPTVKKESNESFGDIIKNYGVTDEARKTLQVEVKDESSLKFWAINLLPAILPLIIIILFCILYKYLATTKYLSKIFGWYILKLWISSTLKLLKIIIN